MIIDNPFKDSSFVLSLSIKIILNLHPHPQIQQIEQILNHLHILRRHYRLHIGCHSREDQIRYDRIPPDA